MLNKSLIRPVLAGFFLWPTIAQSDSSIDASEPLVVTATRAEQSLGDSLAAVRIIDRDDIDRSQAPDLIELLRLEAGVDILRGGGPGAQTSLFLRGSNSNQVLVLIDGVRVAAAGTGAFAWEVIDPALIERIEIVRGPRAARWGSDAIGGVIQIFTRQSRGLMLRTGLGRYGDRKFGLAAGNDDWQISAAYRQVDGFSAQNSRGFAFDPDKDGFDNQGLALRGRIPISVGELTLHARATRARVEFDQGESDVLNYSGGLDWRLTGPEQWIWTLSLATLRDRLETATAFGQSEALTRRLQLGAQAERPLGPGGQWLIGLDGWRESSVNRGVWSQDRNNIGVWTGISGSLGRLDHEASLRIDRDSGFGSAVTGNLSGGWRLSDIWRLQASLGRSFRAPNFNQLFSPGFSGLFAGNPDLDPERSLAGELGLLAQFGPGQRLLLTGFESRISDLIDFAGDDFQAINIRRARIRGVELEQQWQAGAWLGRNQLTWLDAIDRDNDQPLLRRARYKAAAQLDYRFPNGGWLGAEASYSARRFDIGQVRLDDALLVNLRAGWSLGRHWQIEGRLDNLTDRQDEPLIGFNGPGRALHVALRWMR